MTVSVTKKALNVREKLAELDKPTGIAGEAMLRAETPQEQFNLIGAGRRNWIINGDFQVSQRGDYTSATAITTSSTYYVDRWAALIFAGNNGTIQKATNQTLPNGSITDSLKLVSNVSGGNYALWQWVEDYKAFRGQEATLSFWYKSNCDQVFNYYTYAAQTHVGLPNTNGQWVYFKHTRKHETNATGMRIEFYPLGVSLPSGGYLELAQVQLELGKVATPFEHRSYGEELALCQRYFCKLDFPQTTPIGPVHKQTTNTIRTLINLPVPMRAEPSINSTGQPTFFLYWSVGGTDNSATNTSGTAFTVVGNSLDNARVTLSAGVGGVESLIGSFFGYSGDLNFDAEL